MRLFRRLRKLVSVPRLVVLLVVVAVAAGTLAAVHITAPSGGSVNAGILSPGSQGSQSQGVPWWDPRGWFSSGSHAPASRTVPGTESALPSPARVVRQAVAPPARRVRELTSDRSEFSRTYLLSDGRRQAVISAGPVNYRDAAGRWEPIDTNVVRSSRAGFSYQNTMNVFGSLFSSDPAALVRFELPSGGWLQTGLPGGRRVAPRVSGNTVSYPGILPGVSLQYAVSPSGLKEQIVLASASADVAGLRFTVRSGGGLVPRAMPGGATGWYTGGAPVPVLISPAPFMTDARTDRSTPLRHPWSPVVQQTSWDAARSVQTVSMLPGRAWLEAAGRVWPVTVDPTIMIAPVPCQSYNPDNPAGCAHNVMISSDSPATNFNSSMSWPLPVGTTATGVDRGLIQFPLGAIPSGSSIDSADLNLYWDDSFTASTASTQPPQTVQAFQATTAWNPTTVTWNSNIGLGTEGVNQVVMTSTDAGTSASGAWPSQASTAAANGSSYRYDQDTTAGDAFTFVPQLTEPGTYQIDDHYVASTGASSAAPVTVNYQGGSKAFTVNQQSGTGGVWSTLGSEPFAAGTAGSAVVGDGPASATVRVEADGVRFTKFAQVTDASAPPGQGLLGDRWDSFAVRNIVQNWVSGQANDGFVLKAANESAMSVGGPEYERSGFYYTGETATYPQLVVTYGQLTSVVFNPITVIRDNGADLSWTPYVNSTGNPGDDLAGYQVYRSVFQSFTPSADTLVANVPAGTTSFDDTTSVPAPPTASSGNAFYYMIAVRTANGTVVPGPVQLVRLPVAGKTVAVIFATGTATLSSAQPTANLQSLFGFPWTETGDNGGTGCSTCYGTTRSVFTFGSVASAIPAGSRITLGQLKLWGIANNGSTAANYQVHNITGSFTAASATWNSTANQFDSTALDAGVTGMTSDPQAEWLTATSAIQSWLDTPSSQHGLMVKLQDESSTGPQDQELWLTGGAAEQWLRPYLVITYADPASAYEAPATPHVSQASSTYTTPVTVTNTTTGAWGTNMQLGYHWATPDGTIVSSGTSAATLPSTLNSGTGTALTATVTTPPTISGGTRSGYQLAWDMYNKTTGTWASSNTTTPNLAGTGGAGTVPAAGQVTSVAETAETLGLEKYYQYTSMPTGAGSGLENNDATGNTVWNYSPFSNPSRGFRTFVRLDYNSMDTSESSMGFGWSLQASTLTRLGTPLDFQPPGNPTSMTLTDGNGGSHVFTLNTTVTPNVWTSPAGFHYYLQSYAACNVNGKDNPAKAWLITAPDGTKFYFDCEGYQTAVVDRNGNEADFSYNQRKSENSPEEFLDHITDPASRQTLTLTYYTKGQNYSYINDTAFPPTVATGTNLTNPDIIDQVASITDVSGRKISFLYDDQGLMSQMTDGPNTDAADGPVWTGPASTAKTFAFGYDPTQGNKNVKLVSVTDPRNDTTCLYYYPPSAAFKWALQAVTSRRADSATSTGAMAACPATPAPAYETQFAYTAVAAGANPLLPNGGVQADVTDPLSHTTSDLTDTAGRPVQVTDPVGRNTTLAFDSDNNLTTQTENNGAVTKWTWDPNTGYPLTMQDAANQATGKQYSYSYQYSLPTPDGKSGHVAFLTSATSPLGNTTTYGLDAFGNVTSVTKPDGNVTGATAGSFTTSYTYNSDGTVATVKDPDGNITRYPAYDPTGLPTQVTDARGNTVTRAYSPTGKVTSDTDAYGHTITTTQYDVFGRAGLATTRKSATQDIYTATPVYDGNSNVTTSYAPSYSATTAGAATTKVYNSDDQVTSTTTPPDSGVGTGPTTTSAYNNDDTLASVTRPDAAPAGSLFTPAGPVRVMDTRNGTGGITGPVGAGQTVSLQVTGMNGVPASGVRAVVLNVTATQPSSGGDVIVFPDGTARPVTSNLNYTAGETIPNLVVVPVGADGKVDFYNESGGTVQLLADLSGYYTTGSGSLFTPAGPVRVMDTRNGTGGITGPVGAGQTVSLQVTGMNGVPASGVRAVVLNVTATQPSSGGDVIVFPDGTARPVTSNLNYTAGETIPNLVVVPVGADGKVDFYNASGGTVQLLADLSGYYTTAQYTTTYAYYPDQKVQTVTDGLGNQTSYTYDNAGNTYQVTDPDKNTTTTTYDLDHRKQQVTDPNGNFTQTTYDADGRTIQSRDKNGNVTLFNYDASGQLIQQQVPVQAPGQPVSYATTQYAYDQVGNRTQVLTPLAIQNGSSLFSSPPSACTTTPVTSPCPFTRVTTYNPDNQVATQQTPAGGDGPYSAPQVTSYSYDNNGRQSQVTAPPSNGDLPATGLNTATSTYWDNGWPATSTDPRGIVTSWDYAPTGQQSSRTLTSADGGMTRGMSWSYFPDGKLAQVTDNGVPDGSHTEMVDSSDAAATATGTWATGTCPAAPAQPLPQSGVAPLQPACGGPTYRTHPIAAAGSTTDNFTWHLTDVGGMYSIYVKYPALPAGTTAATGANYTITGIGSAPVTVTGIDQTQHAGTSSGGTWVKLGEWQFNQAPQVTLNPAGSTGAAGSVVVASAVEAVSDTTGITNTAVHGNSYTYDLDGNTTGITGTAGTGTGNTAVTIAVTPDVLDRTSSVTETWANGGPVNTTSYTYDAASNIKTMTHTSTQGTTTTTDQNAAYAWNNLNQLQNETDGPTTVDSTQKTTAFTYTPAGQVQTQQQPNGNLITDQYTAAGQVYTKAECTNKTAPVIPAFPITSPTAITCATGGQLVSADAYTYDVNGQQTQDLSNLMSADSSSTYLSHTWNDTYNGVGQLTQVSDGSTQTEAYQHDPQGNIISQTIGNTSAPATTSTYSRGLLQTSTTSGQTSTYNYDPLGRLNTVTSPAGTILASYTYDGFDNIIQFDQPTPNSPGSTDRTVYSYDPLNRLASEATPTAGSPTTIYSYLGLSSELLTESQNGSITKAYGYTPGGTRLFQTTTGVGNPTPSQNGTAYYSYNNHSDVEALTGPSGTPTATYGYTAYGSPVTSMTTGDVTISGPDTIAYSSYRFNAMRWDASSGQYNMGFRNYDPGLGSFDTRDMYAGSGADMALTSDPFSGGAYAFGDANPISNIEIDGHAGCANTADAICPGETTAAVKSGAAQEDKFTQQYWRSTISDTVNWDLNKCDAVPSCVYRAEERLATNPGYLADQVQGYLGAQLYDAERNLEQQQQAQASSGGCGFLGFSCAERLVSQHWDTITNVATWVGVGACIIVSAGWCTILGAAIAGATYFGNVAIAHQSWAGSNLESLVGSLALVGLGGAVSRLGAESWAAWLREGPLSDLSSVATKGAHAANASFRPVMFAYLRGPQLAFNTAHAFTTPDFMICANQADGQC